MDKAGIRALFLEMFDKGVGAAKAKNRLPPFLPKDRPSGRTVIFALGKAAPDMARVTQAQIEADETLIIAPYGSFDSRHGWPPSTTIIEASHPVPDDNSMKAGAAALALAETLGPNDRMIALISGGGSSLMVAPALGLTLAEKRQLNAQLLASGAPISDMNIMRRALSRVKGGGLARAALPAEIMTFVISDVPGDDPGMVSSGPTIINDDTFPKDCAALANKWSITWPAHAISATHTDLDSSTPITEPAIVARSRNMLEAVADIASKAGYRPILLGDALEGDAVDLANAHAVLSKSYANERVALISGGETSVAISDKRGVGGRNSTYALALAKALNGAKDVAAFAADSDGIDGNSKAAGAMLFPDAIARIRLLGLEPAQILANHDSASVFAMIGDEIGGGATGTNVNDLRVILVGI
jgi:hydroxypyruvate reductase